MAQCLNCLIIVKQNTMFRVSIVSYTFGDSHNWGQLHLKKVQQCRLHQPESGHYWQQTALSEGDHLEERGKNKHFEVITRLKKIKWIVQRGLSRWLVVNSLSLALVDWIKSEATIIGVKQTSQLYFLTKHLNESLWGQIRVERELMFSFLKKRDVLTVFK